MTELNYS